ncbi:hypothetical protein MAPG_06317 [Magnaporthiopsis poae ATCC 64411]|uniref:Uncharacterized protein n=1 Tax=Magnaporthiopsis poae (strain ATCC 64411 / 73-15) TaxID=644358 RepID=A0A0C4E1Q0_MAGP6|nr:hypothetical protein MAPG_06317 [Magnaporthiopsis poae ATCC 64411]
MFCSIDKTSCPAPPSPAPVRPTPFTAWEIRLAPHLVHLVANVPAPMLTLCYSASLLPTKTRQGDNDRTAMRVNGLSLPAKRDTMVKILFMTFHTIGRTGRAGTRESCPTVGATACLLQELCVYDTLTMTRKLLEVDNLERGRPLPRPPPSLTRTRASVTAILEALEWAFDLNQIHRLQEGCVLSRIVIATDTGAEAIVNEIKRDAFHTIDHDLGIPIRNLVKFLRHSEAATIVFDTMSFFCHLAQEVLRIELEKQGFVVPS